MSTKVVLFDEFLAAATRRYGVPTSETPMTLEETDVKISGYLAELRRLGARGPIEPDFLPHFAALGLGHVTTWAEFFDLVPGPWRLDESGQVVVVEPEPAAPEDVHVDQPAEDPASEACCVREKPGLPPDIPPWNVPAPEKGDEIIEVQVPEPAVKPAIDVASLPGYPPPMTEEQARRELQRYRAQEEGEAWRRNPLSWWKG